MLAIASCSLREIFFSGILWTPALTAPSSEAAAKSAPFILATCLEYYRCQSDRLRCLDDTMSNPESIVDGWVGLLIRRRGGGGGGGALGGERAFDDDYRRLQSSQRR